MKGMFIVLEGMNGAGKTTQAEALRAALQERWPEETIFTVREPGGTHVSEEIRELLQTPNLTEEARFHLFLAARAHLTDLILRPALERGHVVIADRYYYSTLVYQCDLGGLGSMYRAMAVPSLKPDVSVLLDIPPYTHLDRAREARPVVTVNAMRLAYQRAFGAASDREVGLPITKKYLGRQVEQSRYVVNAALPLDEVTSLLVEIVEGERFWVQR